MCDGFFHCLYGEDEAFDTCKETFPEEATIECIEDRLPGIDLKVMAVPCNGIVECRNASDELNCEDDKLILVSATSLLFLVTICVNLYLIFVRLPQWKNSMLKDFENYHVNQVIEPSMCTELKGDDLANYKVCFLF